MAPQPQPLLRLAFHHLPDNAAYVPRTVTTTTTGVGDNAETTKTYDAPSGVVAPSYAWVSSPWQFLAQIFPNITSTVMPFQPADFSADLQVNGNCSWSASWTYDRSDSEHIAFVRAAKRTDAFAVWHIDTADSRLNSANFLGGFNPSGQRAPTISAAILPSFVRRGMGGPVMTARSSKLEDGSGLLEVSGTCWGQMLEETTHAVYAQSYKSITEGTSTDAQRLLLWISDLFERNSDFRETEEPNMNPTQIGKWLLRPAFTAAALSAAVASGADFRAEPGGTMLHTLRSFADRAGLIFHTSLPVIWFQSPLETSSALFQDRHFASGTHTSRRPFATSYSSTQNDVVGTVGPVVADNQALIDRYGVIRRNLPSAAPNRGLPALDTSGDDPVEVPSRSEEEITEIIRAQFARHAIRDWANEDGDLEIDWVSGARYGLDWGLGSQVRLSMPEADSGALNVSSVTIRMSGDGDWSFRAGLGATADLAPNMRHTVRYGRAVRF